MRISIALYLIIFAAIGVGCNAAPADDGDRALTITEVIENIDQLDGKTVRVAGYLGECAGYECALFASEADHSRWERLIAQLRKGQDRQTPEPPRLGIGSGEAFEFDRKAAPFTNSYVLITGKVTNQCRVNGQNGCTDRSTDFEPIAITSGRPTQGSKRVSGGAGE